jgi:oxygen-independent coproporphyrinogen-3 oxidase
MDESYRHAITTEIDLLAQSLKKVHTDGSDKIPLSSIYFGGGTPSLAPLETIQSILCHVLRNIDSPFYLGPEAEVTIEMDPGTFDEEYLLELKKMGFNRVSLGVQSFDDVILENIGRVHRKRDIYDAVRTIGNVFSAENSNYSIDLISGLPGLNLEAWEETINT